MAGLTAVSYQKIEFKGGERLIRDGIS